MNASPTRGLTELTVTGPENILVTGGNDSIILRSTNSGLTFDTIQFSNSFDFRIQFLNPKFGVAGGLAHYIVGPTVFKTNDSGQSWQAMNFSAGGGYYLHQLFFIDSLVGFVSSGPIHCKTIDGGQTFDTMSIHPSTDFIAAIHFTNSQEGFISFVRHEGLSLFRNIVVKTADQGATWTQVYSDTFRNAFQFVYRRIHDFHFVNAQKGFALTDQKFYLETNDGGISWQSRPVPSNEEVPYGFNDLAFISSDTGFAVTTGQRFFKTFNGGVTWQEETFPVGTSLMEVEFFNNNIGYLSGHKILKTVNAGTGISKLHKRNIFIKLYPNPASKKVTVLNLNNEKGVLVIRNALGMAFFEDSKLPSNIDVGNWPAGTYIVQYFIKGSSYYETLIVIH